ncbi:uncharacterized protein CTRU02_214951 [Colletotrichum truncatum]|uniref:Uncharacterized protein n=1 Tax=Colletotrichum truncatum TaxID=5467 RepID=A0ACC3YE60_COLTU|nr:uncharacterized protein CTRU02_08296 [Colletotrichum truncatum]KAF6790167.1 hypothetical protein CTRU02_08296 [Colletotrichum truncatum]
MRVTSLIAFIPFLAPALAANHKNCWCTVQYGPGKNDWRYDWQLTFNVCKSSYTQTADYDTGSGHCIANPHTRLDGDRFYNNCKSTGAGGWFPVVNGAVDTTANKLFAPKNWRTGQLYQTGSDCD